MEGGLPTKPNACCLFLGYHQISVITELKNLAVINEIHQLATTVYCRCKFIVKLPLLMTHPGLKWFQESSREPVHKKKATCVVKDALGKNKQGKPDSPATTEG